MARANLRTLFTAGASDGLTAQAVFTNRVSEMDAFVRSLDNIRYTPRNAGSDPSVPRRNLLLFYGTGGIGKTTLSVELERRLHDGLRGAAAIGSTRIDFAEPAAFDLEQIVIAIRGACGALERRWDAFDIAFALYWERAHPGLPIAEFVERRSRSRDAARAVEVAKQIEATVADVLAGLGPASGVVGAAHNAGRRFYEAVRQSRMKKKLTEECPYFEELIDAPGDDETLSYLPALLGWQLCRDHESRQVVVFVDTFEEMMSRPTREFELLFQRIVYLMPSALFVVTGRDAIDWGDEHLPGSLDYTGSVHWPNLVAGATDDPRQHLVGCLSDQNCEDHLCSVITLPSGEPAISAQIRRRIIEASDGLPLYLDLAVGHFLELLSRRDEPTADAFGGSLPAVVARTMRDLTAAERKALRGVSLVPAFDVELAIAAGGVDSAAARRLVRRTFVRRDDQAFFQYSLHAALRNAILAIDHELTDAWGDREWTLASERIQAELASRASDALRNRDPRTMGSLLALSLQCAHAAEPDDKILQLGMVLADLGHWSLLDARSDAKPHPITTGLRGIAARRGASLDVSVELLDHALEAPTLTRSARRAFELHRAHGRRNAGRYSAARVDYERLIEAEGGDQTAESARFQLLDLALIEGRFVDLQEAFQAEPRPEAPPQRCEWLRLEGHLARFNAQFRTAERLYREALDLAEHSALAAASAKAETNIAESLCWEWPADAQLYARRAIDNNSAAGNRLEIVKAAAALAICAAGTSESAAAVSRCLDAVKQTGYRAGELFALSAIAFDGAVRHDVDAVLRATNRIASLSRQIGTYGFLLDIAAAWLRGMGDTTTRITPLDSPRWVDNAALDRWAALPQQRK